MPMHIGEVKAEMTEGRPAKTYPKKILHYYKKNLRPTPILKKKEKSEIIQHELQGAGLLQMGKSLLHYASPKHWDHKIKNYQKHLANKVSSLDPEEMVRAELARESYKHPNDRGNVKDWIYQPHVSNKKTAIYRHKDRDHNIIAYKGTSDKDDILPDSSIAIGIQHRNRGFKDAREHFEHAKKSLSGTWEAVGHSLGGSKSIWLSQHENIPAHAFNPGYISFSDDKLKVNHANNKIYVVHGDPISNSILGKNLDMSTVKVLPAASKLNPILNHTINNFIQDSNENVKVDPDEKKAHEENLNMLEGAGFGQLTKSVWAMKNPLVWYDKIKNYARHVNRKDTMTEHDIEKAMLAREAYRAREERRNIGDFKYKKHLSGHDYAVFHDPKRNLNILSFKGTSDRADIIPDVAITFGYQNYNAKFKNARRVYKKLLAKGKLKGNWETVGHSLGGAKAMWVAQEHDLPSHVYNPGYVSLFDDQIKLNHDKNHVYITRGDPISNSLLAEKIKNIKVFAPVSWNPLGNHTIESFMPLKPKRPPPPEFNFTPLVFGNKHDLNNTSVQIRVKEAETLDERKDEAFEPIEEHYDNPVEEQESINRFHTLPVPEDERNHLETVEDLMYLIPEENEDEKKNYETDWELEGMFEQYMEENPEDPEIQKLNKYVKRDKEDERKMDQAMDRILSAKPKQPVVYSLVDKIGL